VRIEERQFNILAHVQERQELIALKDEPQAAIPERGASHLWPRRYVLAIELARTAIWPIEAANDVQQRRLWESNLPAFNGICNLQILNCQGCRECQRCRRALPAIARGLSRI
jgi:hypothetical protein